MMYVSCRRLFLILGRHFEIGAEPRQKLHGPPRKVCGSAGKNAEPGGPKKPLSQPGDSTLLTTGSS
jgi:hypothetical protein